MKAEFDLVGTYVHLDVGGGAVAVEGGEAFWRRAAEELDRDYPGRLLGVFPMMQDTSTWEMHPAGDEFLYLLSGAIDVVLQEGDDERVLGLRSRTACVVPRGVWHRQIVHKPGDLLFITPGKGTEHRPV